MSGFYGSFDIGEYRAHTQVGKTPQYYTEAQTERNKNTVWLLIVVQCHC